MAKKDKDKEKMPPEEQKKKVSSFTSDFKQANQAKGELVKKWRTIDMFDRAEQWKNAPIPPWISRPNTNLVRYIRTMKRANLFQNIPKPNFNAIEETDEELIRDLQLAHDHVWEEQKVDLTIRKIGDRSLLYGTGVAWVYVDESTDGKYFGEDDKDLAKLNKLYEGKIKVERVKVGNFFIDPSAYSIEEARFCEITKTMPLSAIKNNKAFRNYAGKQLQELTRESLDNEMEANGDIFDRYNVKSNNPSIDDGKNNNVTLHIRFDKYTNANGAEQLDITYYLENCPYFLLRYEDVKPSCYPFAILYDEEEENDFWGTSTAMDVIDNQKIISKAQQAAATTVTLHQNPQRVVQRESGISPTELARTGTLGGKVWQSNIPNPIEILPHPDIPKGNFDLTQNLLQLTKDMAGINEAYTGNSVGSLTTSTGVNSLIGRATIRDQDKSIQINEFVEQISYLIVCMIIEHWQDQRPIMSTNDDGTVERSTYEPVKFDLRNIHYRLKCDVYAKSPVTQETKSQQADTLMQFQGQYQFDPPIITPEEWINMKDFPNKLKILERMKNDREKKKQGESAQLTQQIMQVMEGASKMRGQGIAEPKIMEQVQQMITQIIEQTQSTGASQTMEGQAGATSQSQNNIANVDPNSMSSQNMQNMLAGK